MQHPNKKDVVSSYYYHPSKTTNGNSLQVLSGNGSNGDANTVTKVTTETKQQVSKEAVAAVTPETIQQQQNQQQQDQHQPLLFGSEAGFRACMLIMDHGAIQYALFI
jgi:hypothetical protein